MWFASSKRHSHDINAIRISGFLQQRFPNPDLACPPFGHSTQLRVFVDLDLLQYDEVWAAAGTWNDNFGAAPADVVRVAGWVVIDLKH